MEIFTDRICYVVPNKEHIMYNNLGSDIVTGLGSCFNGMHVTKYGGCVCDKEFSVGFYMPYTNMQLQHETRPY